MTRATRVVYAVGALLAPAAVQAMGWNGPQETIVAAAIDAWSPAPTSAPELKFRAMQLFGKRQTSYDNTCGYQAANSELSLTCNDATRVCATNSNFGVHGCCDPSSLAECVLFTTCYASTEMASCTGSCLSDEYVARCTDLGTVSCYNWLYDYETTTMTEYGCATSGFTIAVSRTYAGENATVEETSQLEVPISTRVVTVTAGGDDADSTSSIGSTVGDNNNVTPTSRKKNNTGAIAGGVVGGVAIIALLVGGITWLLLKNKKKKNAAAAGAPVAGAAAGGFNNQPQQQPSMQQQQYPQQYAPQSPAPQYPQGQYPQGAYAQPQQNSYYEQPKTQDYKYNAQAPTTAPPPSNVAELGGGAAPGPGPYSPGLGSPAPVYSGPHSPAPHQPELDSTPVGQNAQAARGNVHEAP